MMLSRTLYDVKFFDRDGTQIKSMRCRALKAELEVGARIIGGEIATVDFHAIGKQLEDRRKRFFANLRRGIRGTVVSADVPDSSLTAYRIEVAEE